MKEHFIFFALITLLLAGCVTDEKGLNETGQDIDPTETTTSSYPSNTLLMNDDDVLPEEEIANLELRDELNKKLYEEAQKRDANKSPDTTLTLMPPTTTTTQAEVTDITVASSDVKVEVYHFHGNSQCVSCITVGAYAEQTVNTYFSRELKDGKLLFAHINYDLPENKALAEKYGVTGSSLWIGTYKSGKFSKEENVNVWYKINNKGDYLAYLKGVITAKLA